VSVLLYPEIREKGGDRRTGEGTTRIPSASRRRGGEKRGPVLLQLKTGTWGSFVRFWGVLSTAREGMACMPVSRQDDGRGPDSVDRGGPKRLAKGRGKRSAWQPLCIN